MSDCWLSGGKKEPEMQYQWIVMLVVDGSLMDGLRTVGRLLTRDWFPQSFILLGFAALPLVGWWLERDFCKKQKKGEES